MARRKARSNVGGGSGTVTQVDTAGLISGGSITTTGTITTSMATNKLVGRGTAGTGVMEEITLGTGLSMTGTVLDVTFPPDAVTSVNGQTGAVSLDTDDIPEGTNKYFVIAGIDTQIFYNDAGVLGADSNFIWDKTTKTFNVGDVGGGATMTELYVNGGTGNAYMKSNSSGINVLPSLTQLGDDTKTKAYIELVNSSAGLVEIGNAPLVAYADNADAIAGGLVAGDWYQTDGAGAAPLNAAGIVMIVQ